MTKRFGNKMRYIGEKEISLSGSLLVAHPALIEPNFNKAVVLISLHTSGDGAMGVVINRPLGKSLGEHKKDFAFSSLSDIPLYEGGPVNKEQMILIAWKMDRECKDFKIYFGINPEKAEAMRQDEPNLVLRGFLGHAGWDKGQIEGEVKQNAWIVSPIDGGIILKDDGKMLWQNILVRSNPELRFLADAPEDPSVN